MDYAAGGFTCPGVFLIPSFVEGIHIYYSLVFFLSMCMLRVLKHATIAIPPSFFFLLLFSFLFSLRSLHKLQTRIRIGIKRCLVCTHILANEDLVPFFFYFSLPVSHIVYTTRRTVMFVHFVLKKR